MDEIKIKLFGSPDVQLNGNHIEFYRRKCLALLAFLAVTRERHSRESLAGLLWPETNNSRALANLRNVIYTINQLRDIDILEMDRRTVSLSGHTSLTVDVNEFRRYLLQYAEFAESPDFEEAAGYGYLKLAINLYQDDFMAGFSIRDSAEFEHWQSLESQSLNRERHDALIRLLDILEKIQNWDTALQYARQILDEDPLQESLHRRIMTLYYNSGRPSEAVRQYQACCNILKKEFDLEPDIKTRELYAKILSGRTPSTELTRGKAAPGNCRLPYQSTAFIGRTKELQRLEQLIRNRSHRIITITGPGGCGKTRLAEQVTRQCADYFHEGVAWVPLAPVHTSKFIISNMAKSLNLNIPKTQLSPEMPADFMRLKTQIGLFLQKKNILLIMDNFDHLLDGVAVVLEILETAPDTCFLITSREKLNIRGEFVFAIRGLEFPSPDRNPENPPTDSEQLFMQSTQRNSVQPMNTGTNRNEIAEICRIVRGLPLAIELAAAWNRVLDFRSIIEELNSNRDFLSTNQVSIPERHRSIRAVFEQSWQLLSPESRDCYRRLSIFRGGFSRQAAFHVGQASYTALASLIDKSILTRPSPDRFEVHELLRQFAETYLQNDREEYDRIRDRHSQFYIQLVCEKEKGIRGHDQVRSVNALSRDIENIRIAWLRAAQRGDFLGLLSSAPGLFLYFDIQNQFLDGFELFSLTSQHLEKYLHSSHGDKPDETLVVLAAYLLGIQGWFLRFSRYSTRSASTRINATHPDQAIEFIDKALDMIAPFPNRVEWAQIVSLSVYLKTRSYTPGITPTLSQCLEVFKKHQDHWGVAMSLDGIGCGHRTTDDKKAESYFREALKVRENAGDRWGSAISFMNLGRIEETRKNWIQARRYYHQSYVIRHEQHLDINGEIDSQVNLADMEFQLGNHGEAFRNFKQSLLLSETMSNHRRTAIIMGYLGQKYYEANEIRHAVEYLNRCAAISLKHGFASDLEQYIKLLDQINENTTDMISDSPAKAG